jgi:hypothetical protein
MVESKQRAEQPPAKGTANHVSSDLGFVNVNSLQFNERVE